MSTTGAGVRGPGGGFSEWLPGGGLATLAVTSLDGADRVFGLVSRAVGALPQRSQQSSPGVSAHRQLLAVRATNDALGDGGEYPPHRYSVSGAIIGLCR